MSQNNERPCERCGKRPGAKWDGSGGWRRLCGCCKVRVALGGERGRLFAAEIALGATAITGEPASVEINVDDGLPFTRGD